MGGNFFDRWSKRKQEGKEPSKTLQETADDNDSTATVSPNVFHQEVSALKGEMEQINGLADPTENKPDVSKELDLPTEADLDAIQKTANVSAFLKEQVPQALKNRAFKELFKLSSFNHVDMMDVYMDDYNTFTPLTTEMRDKMALAKQLLRGPDELDEDATEGVGFADDATEDDVVGDQETYPLISSESDLVENAQVPEPTSGANSFDGQLMVPMDQSPKENP